MVGHVTPEAFDGGPLALLEDGDIITIDAEANTIDVALDDDELARRRNAWRRLSLAIPGRPGQVCAGCQLGSMGAVTDRLE